MGMTQTLDREHFSAMTGGDRALQEEILTLFCGQAQLWRRLLAPCAPERTWRDAVHTVKGSARSLGLWDLARACEDAEAETRGLAPSDPAIVRALSSVREQLDSALNAIAAMTPSNEA